MNKAKMTFRYNGTTAERGRGEARVIPLRREEYEVVEEAPRARAAEAPAPGWEEEEARSSKEAADEHRRTGSQGKTEREETGLAAGGGPSGSSEDAPRASSKGWLLLEPDADIQQGYGSEFGAWQSSFDPEAERVEQLIRNSEHSQAKASYDGETGYIGRDSSPGREEPSGYRFTGRPGDDGYYKRPPQQSSWLKITASVTGAVVTGVAFGFLVLSMFTGDDPAAPAKGAAVISPQGTGAPGGAAGAKTGTEPAAAAGALPGAAAAVNLPPRSYTILQGGVFSTAAAAETFAADLRKKGIEAVAELGDKNTVYLGLTTNRDDALGLAQGLQAKQEVIVKAFEVPGAKKVRWNGKGTEALQTYISQGASLVQQVASQTAAKLKESEPGPIDEKALQGIKTAHVAWAAGASAVSDGLGEVGRTSLPKMNNALNTAVSALDEYKKNPSHAILWQAQGALLQYLVAEKELLKRAAQP
ncbi:SPOR domain-containing protein [Paenibacillus sp. S-38]|uniref:SPOR domain-containing protein n=1 Tax=Paenibacillus sp. S-38 TaxID=3416710 RepID=UPI003CEA0E75